MDSLVSLTQTKTNLIKALNLIPPATISSQNKNQSSFEEVTLLPAVEQDIEQLNNFWDFFESYHNLKVIALVGMVNAGKSALGNYLLQRGESEVFQEAPVRETSDVKEAKFDENTVIFDLPGLGSVLSDEDDEVVEGILNIADLLIIVLDCNYPIPNHLYEFLKSDGVIKTHALQKIVIVISKIDCLSDLPNHLQHKQINKYINFLYFGNEKMNFPGIASLFDYKIPIVSFSIFQARKSYNYSPDKQLRQEISQALSFNSDSISHRVRYQLYQLAHKYRSLAFHYLVLRKKQNDLFQKLETSFNSIGEEVQKLTNKELENLAHRIQRVRERCFNELKTYATSGDERFWQGENFQRKKNLSSSCKDRHKEEIAKEFISFTTNLKSSTSFIAQSILEKSFITFLPDYESITSALQSSIYEIWDAFDDYFFLDKDKDTFNHSLKQSAEYIEKAYEEVSKWISQFLQEFDKTLKKECQTHTLFQESYFFKEQADALEKFFESFMSIDLVQSILSESSN